MTTNLVLEGKNPVAPPGSFTATETADLGFMVICCAMVNIMTPGLALFYGGLVQQKNVLTMLLQNFASMGLLTSMWILCGFSISFSSQSLGGVLGNPFTHFLLQNMHDVEATIPGLIFCAFQCKFAIITPALMTGAFESRIRFPAFLLFAVIWSVLVYYPTCHMVWSPHGVLAEWGVRDFAGGIVVHATAGFSAAAGAWVLGPSRNYEREKIPHDIPMVLIGTVLLWFGWFGFNSGSAYAANMVAAYACMNSQISASVASVCWLALEWTRTRKPNLCGMCVGAIAGLATITPAAGYVHPWGAVFLGILCVPVCDGCLQLMKWSGIDDALDVWAVHGVGGSLGALMVGPLASTSVNPAIKPGGELFAKQFVAVFGIAAYSTLAGVLILKFLQRVIDVSPSEEECNAGLDVSEQHAEKCHNTPKLAGLSYAAGGGQGHDGGVLESEKTSLLAHDEGVRDVVEAGEDAQGTGAPSGT